MISAFHSTIDPAGAFGAPAGQRIGDALDRLEMAHEPGKVLEVAPEAIEKLDRLIDRDALFDEHAAVAPEGAPGVVAGARGIDPQCLVRVTEPGKAALEQKRAKAGQGPTRPTPPAQPIRGKAHSRRHRAPPFGVADIASVAYPRLLHIAGKLNIHVSHSLVSSLSAACKRS